MNPTIDESPLDRRLENAAPQVRRDSDTRSAIAELSGLAASRVRPRPRRSVRIVLGVLTGLFALGGVTTAAALPSILWEPPDWASTAEVRFDVVLAGGDVCAIAITATAGEPPGPTTEAELAAAREILEELDVDALQLPPWTPLTEEEREARPGYEPEASAYTQAISEAVWAGLVERGILGPDDPSSITLPSLVDCSNR